MFIQFEAPWSTLTPATCSLETEPSLRDVTCHRSYQVEMIYLWKTGLPANPSTIELDRSLMSPGESRSHGLLCPTHPPSSSYTPLITEPIYGIGPPRSVTLQQQ